MFNRGIGGDISKPMPSVLEKKMSPHLRVCAQNIVSHPYAIRTTHREYRDAVTTWGTSNGARRTATLPI